MARNTRLIFEDAGFASQRSARAQRGSMGMGSWYGTRYRRGAIGAFGDTTAVTAGSPAGGTVLTTTTPGGTVTTTAPGVTPPSVLKQKLGSAKGAHGYLVWATSALPPKIAQAVLQAAIARSISYRQNGGQLGVFGDTGDGTDDLSDLTDVDLSAVSVPDVAPVVDLSTVASDAAPSSSWTSAMSSTVASAAAATLSAADAATVNSLNTTQLNRAASGQAPLAVAAGAGIGATAAGSGKALLWGGAALGVILLLMAMDK